MLLIALLQYVYIGKVAMVKGDNSQKVFSCLFNLQRSESKDCPPTFQFYFSCPPLEDFFQNSSFNNYVENKNALEQVSVILVAEFLMPKTCKCRQNLNCQFGGQSFGLFLWRSDELENNFWDFSPCTIYEYHNTYTIPYRIFLYFQEDSLPIVYQGRNQR